MAKFRGMRFLLTFVGAMQMVSAAFASETFETALELAIGGQYGKSIVIWTRLSARGCADSSYHLAVTYGKGLGDIPQDVDAALAWWLVTARQGHEYALTALPYIQTFQHAKARAQQGELAAQVYVGTTYFYGIRNKFGVNMGIFAPSAGLALPWLKMAAMRNDQTAQNLMGFIYATDPQFGQNYQEAARWWRRAVEQGHSAAQFNLGLTYFKGFIMGHDRHEARALFKASASQGLRNGWLLYLASHLGVPVHHEFVTVE